MHQVCPQSYNPTTSRHGVPGRCACSTTRRAGRRFGTSSTWRPSSTTMASSNSTWVRPITLYLDLFWGSVPSHSTECFSFFRSVLPFPAGCSALLCHRHVLLLAAEERALHAGIQADVTEEVEAARLADTHLQGKHRCFSSCACLGSPASALGRSTVRPALFPGAFCAG